MSRMLKNTCLFAEYRSLLYSSFAKKTYIFKHPTNRSHPIAGILICVSDIHVGTTSSQNQRSKVPVEDEVRCVAFLSSLFLQVSPGVCVRVCVYARVCVCVCV